MTVANSSHLLYALDARTGDPVWGPIDLGGTYAWSGAAYDAGRVFAVNSDGVIRAFDASSGALLWSNHPGQYLFSSPPTALQGIVYVGGAGSGGTLFALSETTGDVLWQAGVTNGDHSSPALSDTGVFVSYACAVTQAFSRSTGTPLWSYYGGCSGGGGTTPAYSQQRLFVRDFLTSPSGGIFDALSGALLGRFEAGPIPALANGQSFVLAAGELRASDLGMGTVTWTFGGDGTLSSAPLVVGHQVYIGGSSGNLYALDTTTGQQVWMANVGAGIAAPDEHNEVPLAGLNEGEGLLVVPAGNVLVSYATTPPGTPSATPTATPTPTGQVVIPLDSPVRLADTRLAGGPISSGASGCFRVAGLMGIPADASAVVLNVTSVGQTTDGWLTVYPDGQAVPATSTLNFGSSEYAVANGAMLRVGAGGQVCVTVGTVSSIAGSSQVILDATGYVPASASSVLPPLPSPVRLLDTRTSGDLVATRASRCVQVAGTMGIPADAAAVVLNVTAVGYATQGWLTAYPQGQPVPATSTVNFDPSEYAIANNALVPVGSGGEVCVQVGTVNAAPGGSHIILDATAYLAPAGSAHLTLLSLPQRAADTRTAGGPLAGGSSRCFALAGLFGIPITASGVVLNVTAAGDGAPGWLTVYPSGQPVPATSTLNFDVSPYAVANAAIVGIGTGGQVCVSVGMVNAAPGSAQVILDVLGYLP